MYQELQMGSVINISVCHQKYGISESTFYRYLGDIREYLWEQHLQEIIYFPQENTYKIIK